MPKKKVVNQLYEVLVADSAPVGVRSAGVLVILTQGTDATIVMDLPGWLALCDLREVVRPKRPRKAKAE